MNLTGKSSIAGQWLSETGTGTYQAYAPAEDVYYGLEYVNASEGQVNDAVNAAQQAFAVYGNASAETRATFLNTIADEILALGDELIEVTHKETALPLARLQGERMRTVNQLKLFADTLLNPIDNVIEDIADPARQPLPKPGTRLDHVSVGVVAVFGASNFPYAFSVAGGDTASALAAGCPVVVKGHPAHPGTCELITKAINSAIAKCELPAGTFSLLQAADPEVSHQLVKHPMVKSVGFTGSLNVALQLQKSISTRSEIIPFYGELGSINPQILLAEKLAEDTNNTANTFVQSLLMGQGQFCTSPGVWLVPEQDNGFVDAVASTLAEQASAPLLTKGILASYNKGVEQINATEGVELVGVSKTDAPFHATANIFVTDAKHFVSNQNLQQEIFGPYALIVKYGSEQELVELCQLLEGQLTASIHGTDNELKAAKTLVQTLSHKVGRLIFNQMPTGVEVCHSMNHGGPFPASTDVRTTSVGTQAMKRFQRPICYQNMPAGLFD